MKGLSRYFVAILVACISVFTSPVFAEEPWLPGVKKSSPHWLKGSWSFGISQLRIPESKGGELNPSGGIAAAGIFDHNEVSIGDVRDFSFTLRRHLSSRWSLDFLTTGQIDQALVLNGNLGAAGDVAAMQYRTSNLALVRHFGKPQGSWRAFAGLGMNFTKFKALEINPQLNTLITQAMLGRGSQVQTFGDLSAKKGAALTAGIDLPIGKSRWQFSSSLWYIDLQIEGNLSSSYQIFGRNFTTNFFADTLSQKIMMINTGLSARF